ncbi:MRG/MORF4L-binding protein [Chiloscyllium plagiosum]|uniref:MRG/MORF4L-binding protein n=1 Tax=Chiloscyllium plagiosum TaxID=36176 RepID=UPI001CB82397|nr:MRG/MORF4L-binding protein [Chiloscyllium plagiosum]
MGYSVLTIYGFSQEQLSTNTDTEAHEDRVGKHESEILPFPNGERNFVLPEDIIHEVKEGKSGTEEELKDEHREELLEQPLADEGTYPIYSTASK